MYATFLPIDRNLNIVIHIGLKMLAECLYSDARTVAFRTTQGRFTVNGYRSQYERDFKGLTTLQIIEKTTPEKAALMIPFQTRNEVDLDAVAKFLSQNADKLTEGSYKSCFRKLVCMYDFYAFGY